MRLTPTLVLAVLALPGSPCFGQVQGGPSPTDSTAVFDALGTIDIVVDVGNGGRELGSYGGSLTWDPSVLRFIGFAGGDPPFDTPVVNTDDIASGQLTYADANPIGAHGRVRLLGVMFEALAEPPATSQLDLEFSSLFGAGDLDDLIPELRVDDGSVCIADFAYDLRVRDRVNTILDWIAIPQAVNYDVIRGDLGSISTDSAGVHLGRVVCLENGSMDTTTGAGTEPTNPDTDIPAPGQEFFYLARFHDGMSYRTYGYFEDCARERIVGAGDCP